MPDRLRLESEQPRANDVGSERIGARDHETCLDDMAAERPGRDHRGMSHGDRESDRKPLGHRRDERMHVREEPVLVFLRRTRGSVIVRRRIRHRDVLERQRDRRGFVQFQLIDGDERLVVEHAWVHHHASLRPRHVAARSVFKIDGDEWWAVVIEERRIFILDHVHQPRNSKDLISLGRAGASRYDKLARPEAFDMTQGCTQCIRL